MSFPFFGDAYTVDQCWVEQGYTQIYSGTYRGAEGNALPVVFKCLDVSRVPDWATLQHLSYEAECLQAFSHPRIPAFFERKEIVHQTQRYSCLIQGRMPGETLAKRLAATLQFSVPEVLQVLTQMLHLLRALHCHQPAVLHLDLKPSNILQDAQGRCYLIDFGAAIYGEQEPFSLVGTPGFTPPEQLSGQPVPASDLYALGATALVLLTGSPAESFFDGHRLDFWDRLTLAPAYKSWLEIMVHPDVALRFDDADQALDQLIKHIHAENPELVSVLQASLAEMPSHLAPSGSLQREAARLAAEVQQHTRPVLAGYRFEQCQSPPLQRVSETWWATREVDALPVVIKKLNVALLSDWHALTAFEREIENLSGLQHEAFPELLAVEKTDEAWYLVQRRLPGVSLQARLDGGWTPDPIALCAWVLAVLDVLRVLHKQTPPLVHRDLQPEHILMDGDTPYLLGFGGAQQRLITPGSGGSTQTGSFGYTAPEQYLGLHSPSSDIFSLGMCAVYILRRRSPATYRWEQQTLCLEDVPLPEGVKAWLRRVTHLDPQQRHRTAEDAYVALKHQYKELQAAALRLSDAERQQQRLATLRQAEHQYAQKAQSFEQQAMPAEWYENHWLKTLKQAQQPLPPTLRLTLSGEPGQSLHLEVPGPTLTREPRVKKVRLWVKGSFFVALPLAAWGLLLSQGLFFLPLFWSVALLLWWQYRLRQVQHTSLRWERSQGGQWFKALNRPLGGQWNAPQGHFTWSPDSDIRLEPVAQTWPLTGSYYTLWLQDQAVVANLFLLDSEKAWLLAVLPWCLAQLAQETEAA